MTPTTPQMKDKDTVSKGPKRRDPLSLQTIHALLIPAGTMLRQEPGKPGVFTCPLAGGKFIFEGDPNAYQGSFKKVMG